MRHCGVDGGLKAYWTLRSGRRSQIIYKSYRQGRGRWKQKPVLLLYARYPNINVWMSDFTSTQCALAFKELFFDVTTCRIAMTSTSHRGSKPGQSTDIEHIQHSTLTPGCPADKTLLDPPDPGSKHSSPPNPNPAPHRNRSDLNKRASSLTLSVHAQKHHPCYPEAQRKHSPRNFSPVIGLFTTPLPFSLSTQNQSDKSP